ncbi:MAG TPA: hypothetical protein VGI40_13950 [Pirellulaceae bacterium]|jgi:protein ImuA
MNGPVARRDALVADLRREVERLEGGRQLEDERRVSTGVRALDRLLPGGGLKRGTLVEYLSGAAGGGAATLSLAAAREACGEGKALVVIERATQTRRASEEDRLGHFYPPAAAAWGVDLSAMLVLRTTNEADALWAFDQALRCPGVGAVWGAWNRLDVRDFRRLQLAAEVGGTIGLLVRPAKLRGQPTWAEVRFLVSPRSKVQSPKSWRRRSGKFPKQKSHGLGPWTLDFGLQAWRLQVELVRCRGAAGGQKVVLELDEMSGEWREADYEAAHSVSVFAELADSTARRA